MKWLQNHLAKVLGLLTALQAFLDFMQASPLTAQLGAGAGHDFVLAGSVVTALLTFLAPGKAIVVSPAVTTAAKAAAPFIVLSLILAAAPFGLTACATNAQALNQSLLATATLNNTAVTTTDTLVKTGVISPSDATGVLAVTDKIDAALALANAASAAGQISTATTGLSAISAALQALQACLGGAPSAIVTCLQGVPAP